MILSGLSQASATPRNSRSRSKHQPREHVEMDPHVGCQQDEYGLNRLAIEGPDWSAMTANSRSAQSIFRQHQLDLQFAVAALDDERHAAACLGSQKLPELVFRQSGFHRVDDGYPVKKHVACRADGSG